MSTAIWEPETLKEPELVMERRRELRSQLKVSWATVYELNAIAVSGSRLTSFGGNLCVVQKRSTIGTTSQQRANIRHLGLRGPHSSAVIDREDATAMGRITKVQHLLKVFELPGYVPKGKYRLTIGRGGTAMTHKNIGDQYGGSEIRFISRDEYLSVETFDDGVSALWSSGLSADLAINLIKPLAGAPLLEQVGLIGVNEDGKSRVGNGKPADILKYVEDETSKVEFCRIPFENFDVFWASGKTRLPAEVTSLSEVAIIGSHLDRFTITTLMSKTGSLSISSDAEAVSAQNRLMSSL